MIQWIVTASVLIAVVAALRFLLRGKLSLRLQYALWALVLLRLLVPVSLGSSDISVMNAVKLSDASAVLGYIGGETPKLAVVEPDPNASPEEQAAQYEINRQQWQAELDAAKAAGGTPVTISGALTLIWLSGAALMALWLIISNLRFAARLRRSRRALIISASPLPVYVSEMIDTPCLFGPFRPCVYVTPAVAENDTVSRHSVEHELTHFRHLDHIWAFLRGVCLALHWYNPLVWLAAALSRRDAELACDEGTIKRLSESERMEYGRTLIGLTCQKRPALLLTATTMTGSKRGIKERITLIAKKPKMAIYTLIAVILIAAVAVGCTFTGAEKTGVEPVFTGLEEVKSISLKSVPTGPEDTLPVRDEYFDEMLRWVSAFTLGKEQKDTDVPEPGTNSFSVTLTYADGSTDSSGIDIAERDGISYYIVRPDLPECWHELWNSDEQTLTVEVEALIINALNSDGAYAEAAEDALTESLMANPVETLERIGAREEGVADFLCWSLAYHIRGMALDTSDALSGEGLSESGLYARERILTYFEGDTAAPKSWRMVYLDFFDNELPALSEDRVAAVGLLDTRMDGVPELAVWYEASPDGVLYYTDGKEVYQNEGTIYEGAPPEGCLRAQDGESIEHEAINAFLNSWRPQG